MGKGCKVVVCGMASVGKTAVLEQLLYASHTVGAETSDTQEDIYRVCGEGQDLPKHFFSAADGFVLVYSVHSLESFRRVQLLKKEIDKSRGTKEYFK